MTQTTAAGSQLRAPGARHLASGAGVLSLTVLLSTCQVDKLVNPPPPGTLAVNPLRLTDSAAVGSTALRVSTFEILTDGTPRLDWQAQKLLGSDWLTMAPTGTAPDTVTVSLDPGTLAVGVYRDTVVLTSSNSDAAPIRIPVEFSVHPCRDVAVNLDAMVAGALSDADCASPALPGHYARRYRFAAAAGDSLSVELQTTGFNGLIRLDTVTASPGPTPYPPSLFQTAACFGVTGDPCIHYLPLPATRDYVLEVTTSTPDATGTITMSVHRPRAPAPPGALTALAKDSVTQLQGGVAGDTALVLRADITDPDDVDTLRLEVEVRPVGTPFSDTPTAVSAFGPVNRLAFAPVDGLSDDMGYHWQARVVDQTGRASAWLSAGGNPETSPDFSVNVTEPPAAPTALAQFREDGATPIAVGGVNATLSAVFKGVVADADPGDQLRLEVEVKPVGTPFTGTVSGTSAPAATGATATVTIAGLADNTSYHWRARTVDQTARASAWVSFGGNSESSTDFRVQVQVSQIVFSVQPSNVVAGAAISPAVVVRALDSQGNTLTSFTGGVKITIETGPAGATLTGTDSVNAVAGFATFSNLRLRTAGVYSLRATSGGLFTTSVAFTVVPAPPASLAFTVQPGTTQSGVVITPWAQVTARDSVGNTATSFTGSVVVAITAGTGKLGATLSGTLTRAAAAGVVTFNDLRIDSAATGYTLTASSPSLAVGTSAPFDILPAGAIRVLFNTEPTNTQAGATISTVRVRAVDGSGNTVTSFTSAISLQILTGPAGATLNGQTSRNAMSGMATFNNLSIDSAGTYTLLATATGLGPDTSAVFTINPGPVTKLGFRVQPPATDTAGSVMSPPIVVAAQDQLGNTVTSFTGSITIAIGTNPAGGTLGGTPTVPATAGLASFSTLSIDKAATGYTLRATSGVLTAATSTAFTIAPGSAIRLAYSQPPTTTVAGTAFTPAVQVTAFDAFNNTATGFTGNVTIAIGTNPPPGGVLDGTKIVPAIAGVANFPSLNIDEAGTGYTLTASATGLTGAISGTFNITAAPASVLAFTVQPVTTQAGAVITPFVQVTARDSLGNTATGFAGNVTVAIGANPGGGTLSGTLTRPAAAGVATFNDLRINLQGNGYTLVATSTGLTQGTSVPFNVTPGGANRLVFTTQPAQTTAGARITPAVRVTAQDSLGNTVTSFTGQVTVAIGTNPGGGTLAGTLLRPAVAGVATFDDLSIIQAAVGYDLRATSPGLTNGTSAPFTIIAGPAASLVFTAQPSPSTTAGQPFSPAVAVTARDQFGNTATGFTSTVSLAIGTNPPPGGGVLDGVKTMPAVAGVATFANIDIDEARNGYTLVASSGALNVVSNPFNITPGPTTQLAFTVQPPTSTSAGAALLPAIEVSGRDAFGNFTPAFAQAVNISINSNPGGATLSGATNVTAVAGVAAFSNLSLNKTGIGYTLIAARVGLISDESTPFSITPAAPSSITVDAGNGQSATVGTAVAIDPAVVVRDPFNNPVAGVSVTFAVTGGGGAVVGSPAITNASGIATITSWTLGTTAGANTLQATSGALTPATFTATGTAGPATQMAISAGNGQSATVGTAVAVDPAVIVRDAFNNPVPGISVAFAVTSGGGAVAGSPAVTSASGIATVTSWTLGTAVGANTLQATSGALTPVNFTATGTVGPASQMAISAGDGQSATVGTAVAIDPAVIVRDAFNNPVPGVSVTFAVTGGGGAVVGSPAVTDGSGIATVTSWTLGTTAGANSLQATSGALTPANFTASATAGAATNLAFTVQPANTQAGFPIPDIQVTARDLFGNTVTSFSGDVTIAIAVDPTGTAALAGTTVRAASAGVASFAGLSITPAGDGFRLGASATGLPTVQSNLFNITP